MDSKNTLLKRCGVEDLKVVHQIGYETYNDTFRSMNTVETMGKYLDEAFNEEKILSELKNENSRFYLLYSEDILLGYFKVNVTPAQSDIDDPESLELERIYIKKDFKGKGLGTLLLNNAIHIGKELSKRYIWLGVWEKNEAALKFYEKNGFRKTDKHSFRMGDEVQSDYIMRKDLS